MSVQLITPDVLRWISAQAQAGHKADAVLDEMRAKGWQEDIARSAIEAAKRGSLDEPPPPIPVPEPALRDSPCVIRAAGREVEVLSTMQLPRLAVFGSLLADEECDALVELARTRLARSQTVDNWTGGDDINDARTSDGMYFEPGENELLRRIEMRIEELTCWPADRGEGMQVLRYVPGAQYRPHHDYFEPSVPGAARMLQRGGPRVGTLLMYLSSPIKGGATTFPDVGFQVLPVKGNAVFFSYDRPHPMTCTLHGGAPVIEGEKWVATKWLRAGTFVR
jgi:prolyl 4-hydroxylase